MCLTDLFRARNPAARYPAALLVNGCLRWPAMGTWRRVQQTHAWPAPASVAAVEPAPTGSPVTVVIATRNRAQELGHTLERLAGLPERPPVVVVDNSSRDGTAEMV